MRLNLPSKLAFVAAVAVAGLVLTTLVGIAAVARVQASIEAIQQSYVPKIELEARLGGLLDKMAKGFQDAVAARDADSLLSARDARDAFSALLASARGGLQAGDETRLGEALDSYFSEASRVSQRLIAGETGESVLDSMSAMQDKQKTLQALVVTTTKVDREALATAFNVVREEQQKAARWTATVSIACVLLALFFMWWVGRGLIRALASLTSGLGRFAKNDFAQPIKVFSDDELGDVARAANRMADSLRRHDWLRSGQEGLVNELRGGLEPKDVARRALHFLGHYLQVPAAALYVREGKDGLLRLADYRLAGVNAPQERFRLGEGYVGQAALGRDTVVVDALPDGYLRVTSAFGGANAARIVLIPLIHADQVIAVIELASFAPWSADAAELIALVREGLAVTLEAARTRADTARLLVETQTQGETLAATNEELQTQQEELRQTNEELTELTSQLATVSAYKSQFLANMSHELRTPLNSMLLLSHQLGLNEDKNLTSEQIEHAKTIFTAGKGLLTLINQVLDLSKIEAGKQEVKLSALVIPQLADNLRRVFEPLAHEKKLTLSVQVASDVPERVTSDPVRVEQIVTNLLGNAIKFTDSGQVSLSITRAGNDLLFAVADTGLGIPEQERERVFAPFEQLERTGDRRHGGTGLGLPISRELARLLGGDLTLERRDMPGSRFVLRLPLNVAPKEERPSERPTSVPDDRRLEGAAILVIEDDPVFAQAFAQEIHNQGLKFLLATSGAEGVRLAKERRPRGIVLDVKLSDMDGFEVMARLRADPELADIPVHFASMLDATERGMSLGAVGYLHKPASRQDIMRVVETLVPRAKARSVLVVEDNDAIGDSVLRQLSDEGIQAARVNSAAAALAALSDKSYGCMVLDLSLPDMDGLTLLGRLHEVRGNDMPAVVVYTARALTRDEIKRLESYTETIVLKEGSSNERLLNEIRLFVRRLQTQPPKARKAAPDLPPDLRLQDRVILIVDDDMRTVYALSATLRAKGAEVLVADNGKKALSMLAAAKRVDLVLMDIMMPEMDGYETMRRMRADPRWRDVPIVALTAKAMPGDAETCLAAGASDYLPKPVDPTRLLVLMHARLNGTRA